MGPSPAVIFTESSIPALCILSPQRQWLSTMFGCHFLKNKFNNLSSDGSMFSGRSREAIWDFFQYHMSLIPSNEGGIYIFFHMHRLANLHIKKSATIASV